MAEYKKFSEMTDDEIIVAFRRAARRSQHTNGPVKSFNHRVQQDHECYQPVAIIFSSPNDAGQRMYMGMVNSPTTGTTINF